jgi:hypothetical protein
MKQIQYANETKRCGDHNGAPVLLGCFDCNVGGGGTTVIDGWPNRMKVTKAFHDSGTIKPTEFDEIKEDSVTPREFNAAPRIISDAEESLEYSKRINYVGWKPVMSMKRMIHVLFICLLSVFSARSFAANIPNTEVNNDEGMFKASMMAQVVSSK